MAKRKKYRKRATKTTNKKIGWIHLVTNRRLADYNTIKPAVNYLLSDDSNFKKIVRALETQTPGAIQSLRQNPEYDKYSTDKDKLAEFISGRLRTAQEIYRERGQNITISQLIDKEFKTETYVSKEERFSHNLNKIFSARKSYYDEDQEKKRTSYIYQEQRDFFREHLGTTNLNKLDIKYLNQLPYDMPRSRGSLDRGYIVKDVNGRDVIFEMVREKVGSTEYLVNVVIRYVDNNKWKSLNTYANPDM